jgi:hypothetical protein
VGTVARGLVAAGSGMRLNTGALCSGRYGIVKLRRSAITEHVGFHPLSLLGSPQLDNTVLMVGRPRA